MGVRLSILVLGCALLAGASGAAFAQGDSATGSLEGRLTDWHSLPLAQATVVVRNLTTGVVARGVTGRNGSYRFSGLGAGEYRLEADVPSLGKGAVEGIVVAAGHATRVQAALLMELPKLPVEPDAEADAESEAEEHALDPVAPVVTTVIAQQELQRVPVSSRDWGAFEALTPGANPAGSGQIGDQAKLGTGEAAGGAVSEIVSTEGAEAGSGQSGRIDGVTGRRGFRGVGLPGEQGNESVGASLGESAVLSMEARTGDGPADIGRTGGGSVDMYTEHGRNGLHGQVFFLSRQGWFGARNPFTQWVKETAGSGGFNIAQFTAEPYSPADDRETLGIGVGGKIRRDTLFWFAALDGLLRHDPAVATVRHPVSFFARPLDQELTVLASRLGLSSVDPVDEAVLAYSQGLESLDGLLGPVARSLRQWQGFVRVDWQLGERNHLSVEGNAANLDAPSGAVSRTAATYGSHSFGNREAHETWGLARVESFLSADLLNAFGVQYLRGIWRDLPQTSSSWEQSLTRYSGDPLPEMIADSKYGFVLGKPTRLGNGRSPDERSFSVQDTLSWVRGAHLLKVGGSFDHVSDAVGVLLNQDGTYSYADTFNFVSDASNFLALKGFGNSNDPDAGHHNCDATGKVPKSPTSDSTGIGPLPCYAWYSQRIGPTNWHLSTNELAAFVQEQWQPFHNLTISAGVRVEAQQLPPVIAGVANPDLSGTQELPSLGLNWGPRFGLAWSLGQGTVLRAGAGLYYGAVDNSTVLAALTQTGSANGDLTFFFKPTDFGAPPFPHVFPAAPATEVRSGAVSFGSRFRLQQVDQAVVSLEREMPDHWLVSVSGLASLGRRLPISVDTNLVRTLDGSGNPRTITYDVVDASGMGPIKTPTITAPLYTSRDNGSYQQLASIESRANSTYDAAMFKIVRYGGRGLSLHAHYLLAHAADWNPNETGQVSGDDVLDPEDFRLEYGASNLDIRHSAGATVLYSTPWKLRDWEGMVANGWSVAAVGQFRSGLPFTIRTSGYVPGFYAPLLSGGHTLIEGVAPGMNGSGGDNRIYGIGRNTYRYPATWTGDARLAKRFIFPHRRQLELLAESFNLLNHQNVTLIETTGYSINRGSTTGGKPTFNFLTGLTKAGLPSTVPEFGKPLDVNATNFYRQREFEFGLRLRF
jgi:hypothetical protein